ncbi:MAG: thioester domain-containing protein, partial [Micromonosporaceae bacterium]
MRDPLRARLKTASTAAIAAVAVLALAAPAGADPVRGHFEGSQSGTASHVKIMKGSDKRESSTSLLRLNVGGKVLLTYCIQLNTTVKKVGYQETGWSDTTLGANAKHINWILHHSYPYLTTGALAKGAGLDAAPTAPNAVAGTQAAIWHYSDGFNLRMGENDPVVEAIYTYLTGAANTGLDNEPAPTLSLSPDTVSGEPGKLLGPVTVTTTSKQAAVALAGAPKGAKLLGPDKKTEVTTAKNGDKLWVSVPENAPDGNAKVTADVVGKVSPGRVFKGYGAQKTQTLILAGSDAVSVHHEAAVNWANVPTAAPGSQSEQVCQPDAGVKITLSNQGDADAEFTVSYGETTDTETVKAGESKWRVIPVKEDEAYKITVKSGDHEKTYEGVLNCAKDQPEAPGGGGSDDLPTTGSDLTTYLGVGGGLLVAGLVLLLMV